MNREDFEQKHIVLGDWNADKKCRNLPGPNFGVPTIVLRKRKNRVAPHEVGINGLRDEFARPAIRLLNYTVTDPRRPSMCPSFPTDITPHPRLER